MRFLARAAALCASLLLAACATQPLVIDDPSWLQHEQSVAAVQDWQLSGRLVVRQDGNTDTVNINWLQQDATFDLRLFGSLGLGTVQVSGNDAGVTVERSGEEPVMLPSLDAVSQEFFGYEFPTAELLYWVRGLPAPALSGSYTFDMNGMLATLVQRDAEGLAWNLSFDRYMELQGAAGMTEGAASTTEAAAGMTYLPGRISAQREGLELRFLIDEWVVPETALEAR